MLLLNLYEILVCMEFQHFSPSKDCSGVVTRVHVVTSQCYHPGLVCGVCGEHLWVLHCGDVTYRGGAVFLRVQLCYHLLCWSVYVLLSLCFGLFVVLSCVLMYMCVLVFCCCFCCCCCFVVDFVFKCGKRYFLIMSNSIVSFLSLYCLSFFIIVEGGSGIVLCFLSFL